MTETAANFRKRLRQSGLSETAISAAWPEWWSESADASASARAELRFSVARKLGLDARSLLEQDTPRFIWDDSVKYKGFRGNEDRERPVISSFGTAVGRILLTGTPEAAVSLLGVSAAALRRSLLAKNRPFIELRDLLALAWGLGIPVIHLRVYPLSVKRMVAMSVRVENRFSILLAKDGIYPAYSAFHLAHEIGHIALGHVARESALVDMTDASDRSGPDDPEETGADEYALELLTGFAKPQIEVRGSGTSAKELASQSLGVGSSRQIEPGILALCYGFSTGNWAVSTKALSFIYSTAGDVWREVNKVADLQLRWAELTDESSSFIRALLGGRP